MNYMETILGKSARLPASHHCRVTVDTVPTGVGFDTSDCIKAGQSPALYRACGHFGLFAHADEVAVRQLVKQLASAYAEPRVCCKFG